MTSNNNNNNNNIRLRGKHNINFFSIEPDETLKLVIFEKEKKEKKKGRKEETKKGSEKAN